jgi:predicted small integral membrane protein
MIARLSKALLVLMVGMFSLLVGIDNIIDYGTNYAFVEHVMEMDTVFPDTTLKWRALSSDVLNHAAYAVIIAVEILTGLLCVSGALRLWQARGESAAGFNASKGVAMVGLVCGFGLWFFGFLTVGGEWFQMWQSKIWNGEEAAFRFVACIGLVLIFLNQRDDELA